MKSFIRLFFSFILSGMTTICFANSVILSSNSFHEIQTLLQKQKSPHQVLLALDDDDTLTMMPCKTPAHCQYLGGPAWFTWQSQLPAHSKQRIFQAFPQLLSINNLIFTMSKMVLDDPAIPSTLQTTDHLGMSVVVASARGYNMIGATETQLQQNNILTLIEKNAIKTFRHHISYPGFYFPKPWDNKPVRAIAYVHGVLYLAGQNKGEMLKQFLSKTHQANQIHTIIFVDDTMQNVKDVAKTYAQDPSMNAICIHFTRLAAHKAAFLAGKHAKHLQMQANQQWFAIRDALRKNLVDSDF